MANVTQLYQAIKALLVANFVTDYPANVIMQGFQNNVAIPANGKFIIMTKLPSNFLPVKPVYSYDSTTEIENYTTLGSVNFQVDFYGTPASDTADQFKLILDSYATQFFIDNNYDCTVHKSGDVLQLTDTFGREMYQPRYGFTFSLFNNVATVNAVEGLDDVELDIRFAPVQGGDA